jgi:hypothetical protein
MQVGQQEQAPLRTIASRPMCPYPPSSRYDGHVCEAIFDFDGGD